MLDTTTDLSPALAPRSEKKSIAIAIPRVALMTWAVFWATAVAFLAFAGLEVSLLSGVGIALLGAASLGAVFFGAKATRDRALGQLAALKALTARGELAPTDELIYTECLDLASAIQGIRRTYRDEIEGLQRAAFRDPVTGLPNLNSLKLMIDRNLPKTSYGKPAALFHLRIDGFENSGTTLGSDFAERLERDVSSRLSLLLATMASNADDRMRNALLASKAFNEFMIFLPDECDRQAASVLARHLKALFSEAIEIDGRQIRLGLIGGIAMAPDDGVSADTLIKNAGMALDEMGREGKAGFQFFTPRLERVAVGRQKLEQELRDAVSAREFQPFFQPKICFRTGRMVGAEALARWNRPSGQMISPGAFIPLAEELGLIDEIGFQILDTACHSAAKWNTQDLDLSVAVNVAPSQFDRTDFVDRVLDALRQSGLPPRRLELEITETMAVSNPDRVINVMHPLRAMGVKLAIDDFGTGHANLSMLTQLPFDIFKIDRQFVSSLEQDQQAPAIVEMILAMAETLGLETVSEGVETEAQAAFLRRRGCTIGQGFLFSRPIPDPDLQTMAAHWIAQKKVAS
ncbi:MAG: phosphodiesterase [Pseudomonadota bacterium]